MTQEKPDAILHLQIHVTGLGFIEWKRKLELKFL
jgi:hypothetical protein